MSKWERSAGAAPFIGRACLAPRSSAAWNCRCRDATTCRTRSPRSRPVINWALDSHRLPVHYGTSLEPSVDLSVMARPQACWLSTTTAITRPVSYTHLRAHETPEHLVC